MNALQSQAMAMHLINDRENIARHHTDFREPAIFLQTQQKMRLLERQGSRRQDACLLFFACALPSNVRCARGKGGQASL